MKRTAYMLGLCLATCAGVAPAQVPYVVKDINPGPDSSDSANLVAFDGYLYFRANDSESGFELWRSDGTPDGTALVVETRPGADNGFPQNMTAFNDRLYFSAYGVGTGNELWSTDGTAAGTTAVSDTNPGPASGNPEFFVPVGNTLFFRAMNEYGLELWRTDGTTANTNMVKDIHPGDWSIPSALTALNGRLYFSADDSYSEEYGYDRELWTSDGTEAGTYRVKDINPGPAGSTASSFVRLGNAIYFQANDGTNGIELWRTDGTAAGTTLFKDINPSGSGVPMNLARAGDNIYFIANDGIHGDEFWKTDGSVGGTIQVKDINPGGDSSTPLDFTEFDGGVAFSANDGVHGIELWWSDGTETGTHLVKDINPGPDISSPLELTPAGDELYFVTIVSANPEFGTVYTELWKSDGTEDGTAKVWRAPGEYWGYSISELTLVGDHLFFTAPTGIDEYGYSANFELYALTIPEPGSLAGLLLAAGLLLHRRGAH